jgi:heme exporter protein D
MTHLPFIVAAYGLTGAVILWLVTDATLRTRRARRRLRALDPRGRT